MKHLHTLLLFLLPLWTAAQEPAEREIVHSFYFPSASAQLDSRAEAELAGFAADLQTFARCRISIEAHTDEQGSAAYNQELAQQRARAVEHFLRQTGITDITIESRALGEREAATDTESDEERRRDRRVDLTATVTAYASADQALQTLTERMVQTTEALDPTVDQYLVGDKGLIVDLPANSLATADGTAPVGKVTFEVLEAYTAADIVALNLHTIAGGRVLESGGMFRLTARDEADNELRIAEGRELRVSLPTQQFAERMQLFAGRQHEAGDSTTDGQTGVRDWEEIADSRVFPTAEALLKEKLRAKPELNKLNFIHKLLLDTWTKQNPGPPDAVVSGFGEVKEPQRPRPASGERKKFVRRKGIPGLFGARERVIDEAGNRRDSINYLKRVERYEYLTKRYEQQLLDQEVARAEFDSLHADYLERWKAASDGIVRNLRRKFADEVAAYRADSAAYVVELAEYQARLRAARQEFARRTLEEQLRSGGPASREMADRYFATISELGWINIDRYLKTDDTIELYATLSGSPEDARILVLPSDVNAYLPMQPRGAGYAVSGIPATLRYKIIAYYVQDGQLHFAFDEVAGDDLREVALDGQPISPRELQDELARML